MESLDQALPWAILAVALLASVYFAPRWYRRAQSHLSYPRYGFQAVCPHCVIPFPRELTHICPSCTLPVSGFAATDPILRIAAMGSVYRRAASHPTRIATVGLVILAGLPLTAALGAAMDPEASGAVAISAGALPWLLILRASRKLHASPAQRGV